MAENSVYLSKKDLQEKKGPGTEERTEPYSCTEFRFVCPLSISTTRSYV